jgi:hypothetical protein
MTVHRQLRSGWSMRRYKCDVDGAGLRATTGSRNASEATVRVHKKKRGRSRNERPKSREETPKEGSETSDTVANLATNI